GIRDLTVTGVQTCALPISFRLSLGEREEERQGRLRLGGLRLRSPLLDASVLADLVAEVVQLRAPDLAVARDLEAGDVRRVQRERSEERRVGKGGRGREAPG